MGNRELKRMNYLKENWLGWITVTLLVILLAHNIYLQNHIEIMQRKLTCLYDFLVKIDSDRGGRLNPCSLENIFQ